MPQYIFEGDFKRDSSYVAVRLLLIHFEDEQKIQFVYSPHLDLTGYGKTLEDARKSFQIALEDFVDYTIKKKTIGKVLKDLGWEVKGRASKPKKLLAPGISSIIGSNDYVSEIFDKYETNTFHQEIGIPAFA